MDILTKVGPQPTYVVDEIASEQGHEVLRTPPYHLELQPIETCWGIAKNEIARNCDFTMNIDFHGNFLPVVTILTYLQKLVFYYLPMDIFAQQNCS